MGARERQRPRHLFGHLCTRRSGPMAGIRGGGTGIGAGGSGHRAAGEPAQGAALADQPRQEFGIRYSGATACGIGGARSRAHEQNSRTRPQACLLRDRAGSQLFRSLRARAGGEGAAVAFGAGQCLGLGDGQRARSRHRLHALWVACAQHLRARSGAAARRSGADRHGRDERQPCVEPVPLLLWPDLGPDVRAIEYGRRDQDGHVDDARTGIEPGAVAADPEGRRYRLGDRHAGAAQTQRHHRSEPVCAELAGPHGVDGPAQGFLQRGRTRFRKRASTNC